MTNEFDLQIHTPWEAMFTAFADGKRGNGGGVMSLTSSGQAERKNGWQLAEIMHESGSQEMQRLLNAAQDAGVVCDALCAYVVEPLGVPSGVLVVDETGFLKKGQASVA